jgi:hypothetical protein
MGSSCLETEYNDKGNVDVCFPTAFNSLHATFTSGMPYLYAIPKIARSYSLLREPTFQVSVRGIRHALANNWGFPSVSWIVT